MHRAGDFLGDPDNPAMNPVRMSVLVVAAVAVNACAPAFDWREVRAGESGVSALLPCRPSVQTRTVQLAGSSVALTLHVCTAGGISWAVAAAKLAEPGGVAPALAELALAAQANVAGQVLERSPFDVGGGTPNANAARMLVSGRLPDGRAVRAHVGLFARATWVVQVTALGVAPAPEAVATFFDSVQVKP